VEQARLEREKRAKEIAEWKSQLKGTEFMYTKRSMPEHPQ